MVFYWSQGLDKIQKYEGRKVFFAEQAELAEGGRITRFLYPDYALEPSNFHMLSGFQENIGRAMLCTGGY